MSFYENILLLVMSTFLIQAHKLPSSIERCSRSDPKIGDCMKEKIWKTLPILKEGIKELNINKIDPFEIPEMTIGEGQGAVSVVQHFKNVLLHGLSTSSILDVSFDFKNKLMKVRSLTPELRLEADYDLNGKVLLLPITGNGKCNVTLVNVEVSHDLIGEEYQKGGQTHWKFSQYAITLHPKLVTFKFENLFNGDPKLSEQLHTVLNENWKEIFDDVKSGYEKSIGLILMDFTNRIYSKFSIDDLYLE